MWETFTLFSSSYVATLAMGLVCAYLGVFCVLRRIVFTGVALAQLAAGGVAVSFFVADLGLGPLSRFAGSYGATWGSLGASLAGLLGLQARPRQNRVTEDALVGLAYSAAGAFAILLVWRSSRGLTELQNILAGTVLLPRQSELVSLWIGLAAVVAVHAIYRRELLLVSFDAEFARAAGLPERRYQLLFLATLAVAVALALKAGGLLLVFAFLVVPPLAGLALGEKLGESTVLALCVAAGGSFLGFLCSIGWDWPVGPSVAVCLVLLLGVCLLSRKFPELTRPLRLGALGLGAVALLAAPTALIFAPAAVKAPPAEAQQEPDAKGPVDHHEGEDGEGEAEHHDLGELLAKLDAGDAETRVELIPELASAGHEALGPLLGMVLDPDAEVRDAVDVGLAVVLTDPEAASAFDDALSNPEVAPLARLHAAIAAVRQSDPRGAVTIVDVLEATEGSLPLMAQDEAVALLRALQGGEGFGYDAMEDFEFNVKPLASWRDWLRDPNVGQPPPAELEQPEQPDPGPVTPPQPTPPSPAELAEAAAKRLRSGPDRLSAARELFELGPPGHAVLDAVLVGGPPEAARTAAAVLPAPVLVRRLASGGLLPAIELEIARELLHAWHLDPELCDPEPAFARLTEAANPLDSDLELALRALDLLPAAQETWDALSARRGEQARKLVIRGLASGAASDVRVAAIALETLPQQVAVFELAWADAGGSRDLLLIELAQRPLPELSQALRTRYGAAGAAAKAALLRRVGRELDPAGWSLVGEGLEEPDPEVRRAAREALAEFTVARAARAEWEALEQRSAESELIKRLRAQLTEAEPSVAANAAQALADLRARDAIPDLVSALERDEPELRDAIRAALREFGLRHY